jgi:hypothetical protein
MPKRSRLEKIQKCLPFKYRTIRQPDAHRPFQVSDHDCTVKCRYPDESGYRTAILGYNRFQYVSRRPFEIQICVRISNGYNKMAAKMAAILFLPFENRTEYFS